MTRLLPLSIGPILLASALIAPAPAAAAEPAERAVGPCRAEMLSHFPENAVRAYRVASISGSARRTRVTFSVTADRRYTFECVADSRGQILLASFDPPRANAPQLAADRR